MTPQLLRRSRRGCFTKLIIIAATVVFFASFVVVCFSVGGQ